MHQLSALWPDPPTPGCQSLVGWRPLLLVQKGQKGPALLKGRKKRGESVLLVHSSCLCLSARMAGLNWRPGVRHDTHHTLTRASFSSLGWDHYHSEPCKTLFPLRHPIMCHRFFRQETGLVNHKVNVTSASGHVAKIQNGEPDLQSHD